MFADKPLITLTIEQLREVVGTLGFRDVVERCSQRFLVEMFVRIHDHRYHGCPAKIAASIDQLEHPENPFGTKNATPFKHPPLKGLMHKHYVFDGIASMIQNIQDQLGPDGLDLIIKKHFNSDTDHLPREEVARRIACEYVNAYPTRSAQQKLTGEWIVYAVHGGVNYYLCTAKHEESDGAIFERIKDSCVADFPFLASILDLTWTPPESEC